jgi:proteasome lid subunit RPN8/RPN11
VQTAIRIRNRALADVMLHAGRDPVRECCGLLAGRDGVITRAIAAANAAADTAKNYEIAPEELFRLMREIRAAGLAMMGIYHSHPNGNNQPSPHDIERAYYPDAAYFLLSPRANAGSVRAFFIRNGCVSELHIVTESNPAGGQ